MSEKDGENKKPQVVIDVVFVEANDVPPAKTVTSGGEHPVYAQLRRTATDMKIGQWARVWLPEKRLASNAGAAVQWLNSGRKKLKRYRQLPEDVFISTRVRPKLDGNAKGFYLFFGKVYR